MVFRANRASTALFRAYDPAIRPSPLAPLSAYAIAPVGNLLLQVTDCATGQAINVGEAYFSAHVGTGVAPIENGTVGPIGLGDLKFVLTVTSPGYRPLQRVPRALARPVRFATSRSVCTTWREVPSTL